MENITSPAATLDLTSHRTGEDIVLANDTGSGKTRVFHLATALLGEHPPAPSTSPFTPARPAPANKPPSGTPALTQARLATPVDKRVALLTGDQPVATRLPLLAAARIPLLTTDVLHSWLLADSKRAATPPATVPTVPPLAKSGTAAKTTSSQEITSLTASRSTGTGAIAPTATATSTQGSTSRASTRTHGRRRAPRR